MQCVEDDIRRVKLCEDDAQDRVDWRIGIRGNRLTHASMENTDVKTIMMMMIDVIGILFLFKPLTN